MTIPDELNYTRQHEWAGVEDGIVTVGITDFAQQQLGEVVYVELPEVGSEVEKDEPFGNVESVKSVSELYAPMTGRVVEVNEKLADSPQLVNEAPYGEGWMVRIELSHSGEIDELLSATDYEKLTSDAD